MNLIIDQGNSTSKIALYLNDSEVFFKKVANSNLSAFCVALTEEYPVDKAVFSSVVEIEKEFVDFLNNNIRFFIRLTENTPTPVQSVYKTPKTLGKDRLAGVVGANYLQPNKNILVIDAGTAVTFDFIDENSIYRGGNISPGLTMRFKALNEFTSKLPLITPEGELPLLGDSTDTALRSGVVNGLIYEIDAYIDVLKKKYANLFVFLTGGDTFFLAAKLKNSIFADTKLLIKGLNRILNYNADL